MLSKLLSVRLVRSFPRPITVKYNVTLISVKKTHQWQQQFKFHTTNRKQAIPPIIALILRPILKISAILFGRSIRKWWAKLTPLQKQKILNRVKEKTVYLAAGGTVCTGGVYFYYLAHLVEEPITKRKRFIIYNEEQMKIISQMEYEAQIENYKPEIIPPKHPIYMRVARVAMQLIQSNKDLQQVRNKKWTITVIDKPDITNAFVLPSGNIFVFTGMLNICTNDDQLAVVLSHEMSHAILQHNAEGLSKTLFLETLLLVPLILFWATLPDFAALFSQWLSGKLADVMISLPFSRSIETEADMVGLQLAARSCFDVREAPVFWAKMKVVSEQDRTNAVPIEWLSTHPSHERRQHDLSTLVPIALQIRRASSCNLLPPPTYAQSFYGGYKS